MHIFRETKFINYQKISEKNSSCTIIEFKTHVYEALCAVRYSLRNEWMECVEQLFQNVTFVQSNILFIEKYFIDFLLNV